MPAPSIRPQYVASLIALVVGLGVAGCDKKDSPAPTPATSAQPAATPTPTPAPTPTPTVAASASAAPSGSGSAAAGAESDAIEFKIASVGDTMAFDIKTFTVPAGKKVHLTLKNNSTMKAMPHNWVLVKPGTEAKVAAAGLAKGEAAGYLDPDDADVLAHSPVAAMQSTVEFTFTAPTEAGTYPYICTTPGHYIMMKGTLVVTP